jgi:esterase/lipase superfamily enzyme
VRTITTGCLVAGLALAGCQGRVLMPMPTLHTLEGVDAYASVPPSRRTSTVDFLYVTDRVPEETRDGSLRYGYRRSPSVAYGSVEVEIGRDLTWSELVELTSTRKRSRSLPLTLGSITEHGRFSGIPFPLVEIAGRFVPDPEAVARDEVTKQAFGAEMRRRLAESSCKEVIIFIHGFHNTFENAVLSTAEAWHFMKREGVAIAYTWPAGHPGLLQGYNYDRESSEFTVFHLKQLVRALASMPEVERVSLLAHSRGTDVAITALRELVIEARGGGRDPQQMWKIDDVVLLAPDLDFEVTVQRSGGERTFTCAREFTVYVSKKDEAIGIANWLYSSFRRIGQVRYEDLSEPQKLELAAIEALTIIDAQVRGGHFGHGYYMNPAVTSDVILTVLEERRPGAENGRPLTPYAPGFWIITEDYLLQPPDAP